MTVGNGSGGSPGSRCAVCGADALTAHLRVAGEAGAQGLVPTTDRFGVALSDIVRCGACGHMQLARFPDAAKLDEAYAAAESVAYVEEEAGQRVTADRVLDRIERHVPVGDLVDLGCWVGFLLDQARRRGWRAYGVEPSEFASAYARERLGLEVVTDDLLRADLPSGAFDAVVMADVIEHLPDPGAALDRTRRLLSEAGVIGLVLPDAGSGVARAMGRRWWSVIPTHVHYFTRGSLALLLRRHGFEPLEVSTSPKAFTVGYYLSRTGGYSRRLAAGLDRAAAVLGVADRIWAPDFRDRMLVVARRGDGP